MPTYEYRCPEGHEFEEFQKMSDPPVAPCPECGREAQRQLSGGAGLLFKGSGFYITDYRSESYKKAAASEERGSGSGEGGPPKKAAAGGPAAASAGSEGSPSKDPPSKSAGSGNAKGTGAG